MNHTDDLHPLGLSVTTNGFCSLQKMFDLGGTGIHICVIDQGIEFFHGGPDTHSTTPLLAKVGTCINVEFEGLFLCDI